MYNLLLYNISTQQNTISKPSKLIEIFQNIGGNDFRF